MKEEKYIEAMFHYTHGIKRDAQNAYLYSNRSLAFLRMQQYYYALEDAKTTIRLMPKWTKVCRYFTHLSSSMFVVLTLFDSLIKYLQLRVIPC